MNGQTMLDVKRQVGIPLCRAANPRRLFFPLELRNRFTQ